MAIEMLGVPNGVPPNQSATFTFNQQVYAYAIGVMAMRFSYWPNQDHWIQNFSLQILPQQPAPDASNVVGNQVQALFQMQMNDAHRNSIDPQTSIIYPVCIAITGQ